MYGILVVIHIMVCAGLVMTVLFQSSKGAGLGNLFGGGGGGDQLFSAPSGSAFIRRFTTTMAVIFICTSVLLTIVSSRRGQSSVMEQLPMAGSPNRPPGP